MSELLDRVKSGSWLDAQTFAPLAWAVPGLIPEGFGLLTGPPKAGKSWATLGIALAVASGGKALGKVPVGPPRPVLLLALEDGDRRLQARCRHLLDGDPIPGNLHYLTAATPGEVVELIAEWLEQNGHRSPLVVLDTLGRVMPPSLPGESAYGRDYRVGAKLKALVDIHPGSTLLVVHHVRKQATGEAGDWMDSTSGTNGLNGAADWTLNLHRPRNEDRGVIRVTGRDVPENEYAITCSAGSWTIDGTTLADAAQAAVDAKAAEGLGDRSTEILAYVSAQDEPVAPSQVAEALNMPDARRYLARMAEAGRLKKMGRGQYGPPGTGVPSVPMSQSKGSLDSHRVSQERQVWDNGTDGTGVLGCPLHPDEPHPESCFTCERAVAS